MKKRKAILIFLIINMFPTVVFAMDETQQGIVEKNIIENVNQVEQNYNEIGWIKKDNNIFYYYEMGKMQYGERCIDGKWYYFNEETGAMQTGWVNHSGNVYYYDANGAMQYGERCIDGKWYYFDKRTGAMQTGFCKLQNKTVYYEETGAMQYGEVNIDGIIYYFDEKTGALKNGWKEKEGGEKVY